MTQRTMQRTIKTKIEANKDLIETIRQYNQISNLHIKRAFELETNSKKKLHNSCYKEIRETNPSFPSALIQCARDNAIEMLKGNKYKRKTTKDENSNIRYDKRTLRVNWNGDVSISTVNGRKKFTIFIPEYFKQKYGRGEIKSATLGFQNEDLFLFLGVEVEEPTKLKVKNVLGIDLGIKNIYSTSEGLVTKSSELNKIRRKYAHLRKGLQSKGTKSAKRKLKRISGKEKRLVTNWIHKATKDIANKDFELFCMEDLKGIRKRRKGKVFNRRRSQFPYFKFRTTLEYKLENLGKTMILVDPRFTSQRCSKCGFTDKSNRRKGWFKCQECGFQENADVNASVNISQIGFTLFEQGSVNDPNVSKFSNCSLQNKEMRNKPTTLVVGN